MAFIQTMLGYTDPSTIVLLVVIMLLGTVVSKKSATGTGKLPPVIPYTIPFIGSVISFGQHPINFLENAYEEYGEIFSFYMFGKVCTYLIGPDAVQGFFNSKNEDLNAEEVYAGLTVPVFGKGVGYDVPHKVFSEQKRIVKTGLVLSRLETYTEKIEEEARTYFNKKWGKEGLVNLFEALSEVIIATAARCLLGKEIRQVLDDKVAALYADLDGGFTPAAWCLPSWLPLPSFRKRDTAHAKMKQLFISVIQKRRESGNVEEDMLHTLMNTCYKEGGYLSNDQIAGMLIGLLLAGQHTSSATSSWLILFLSDIENRSIYDSAIREQDSVIEKYGETINYRIIKEELPYLDNILKETLRMRPPIMTMMRAVHTPFKYKGYTVPVGHYICVSPTINQLLSDQWKEPKKFNPDRFVASSESSKSQESDADKASVNNYNYIPFGAGRHRCIGEQFAYIQIKTIVSVMLRDFEITAQLPDIDFTTLVHVPKMPIVHYKRR